MQISRRRTYRLTICFCGGEIWPVESTARILSSLQMYENAVALDPDFAPLSDLANVCAQYYYHFERQQEWIDGSIAEAQKASATGSDAPEIRCAEAWVDLPKAYECGG